MSNPFVTFSAHPGDARVRIVNEEEEVIEWSEDFMTPLSTRTIAHAVVVLEGEEVYFFAVKMADGRWSCQRQCGDASQIAEQLEGIGINAEVVT